MTYWLKMEWIRYDWNSITFEIDQGKRWIGLFIWICIQMIICIVSIVDTKWFNCFTDSANENSGVWSLLWRVNEWIINKHYFLYMIQSVIMDILLKMFAMHSNESIKRISISIIISQSSILELCNSFTSSNMNLPFICIPSSVSNGISNSKSNSSITIQYHAAYPIEIATISFEWR